MIQNDHDVFEVLAISVREAAARLLNDQFGERCLEFEPDCICCQRWRLLDQILKNPHDRE